jgi:hypothetical protein
MDRQPPDISLAAGPGARRMTYAELADVRGISRASAERLVRRRKWLRQAGNDGVVRVIVPLTDVPKSSKTAAVVGGQGGEVRPRMSGPGQSPGQSADIPLTSPRISDPGQMLGVPRIIETLKGAVDALRAQLEREHGRVDRAEQRIGELTASLADAVGAERIASGEAAALRAELDRRREWRLFRRLRWALTGDRR